MDHMMFYVILYMGVDCASVTIAQRIAMDVDVDPAVPQAYLSTAVAVTARHAAAALGGDADADHG